MAFKRLFGPRHPVRLGYHRGRAWLAAAMYGFPARRLTVIGMTGSDGKTTTVEMTAHILRAQGIKCGALSTACFRVGDHVTWNETQKTSPSPFLVQRFLRKLVDVGCTHAVLEYSSHGLVQHRLDFTWPAVAAITNLTPEHLDYHGTMEKYAQDKAKLFQMLQGKGTKVLNIDDQTISDYKKIPTVKTITYSVSGQVAGEGSSEHLWLSDVQVTPNGSEAVLHCHAEEALALSESKGSVWKRDNEKLTLSIPGEYNLENALCALACAKAVGIDIMASARALYNFAGAPGRFESIEAGQPFTIIVDFTVTPNAYRKTLAAARKLTAPGKRLLVLCGSCGDRMREKRPAIGRICGELADVVVVTNEDPYTEDPEKIIDEIWSAVDQSKSEAHRIADRRQAIEFILRQAKSGDVILLCGKGADTTMMTANGQIPWDERRIVREIVHKP